MKVGMYVQGNVNNFSPVQECTKYMNTVQVQASTLYMYKAHLPPSLSPLSRFVYQQYICIECTSGFYTGFFAGGKRGKEGEGVRGWPSV